ncbi:MAG TPA: flavodoxin family protein [bacterium]|nr:flavodoxin family protein [bacterium]HPP11236.1 flavodoxin family protein [bacterium]
MKILIISASPRGEESNTLKLAREVASGTGGKVEEVKLSHVRLEFCRACNLCHRKIMACALKDDAFSVLEKMLTAEGIILASPNYINQVTGSLKTLMDRSSHFIHCLRLSGKYVAGVVSSGSGQDSQVLNYIGQYANLCGAQYSGGISSAVSALKEKTPAALALGKKLAADIQQQFVYHDQVALMENQKEHFRRLIELRKNEWPEEYEYWRQQGWL